MLLVGLYLNRSYARIFNWLGTHRLSAPNEEQGIFFPASTKSGGQQTINFVALGDSLTAGVGASSVVATFPYQLAQAWASASSIRLINKGIPGALTKDLLNNDLFSHGVLAVVNAERSGFELRPRTIVTLLIGANDIHAHLTPDVFEQDYRSLVKKIELVPSVQIALITIPYLGSPQLFQAPYPLYFDAMTQRYNERIKKVASEKRLTLIDLYVLTSSSTTTLARPADFYSNDLFHPSDAGYAWWSKLIYANFRP